VQFEQFGKYLLLHKIAVGGMAEIFLAKQSGLAGFEKLVVIKRILPGRVGDNDFAQMFLDEARLAASMSHPNVPQVFDLNRVGDVVYIAMEYIAGQDLAHVLRVCKKTRTPFPHPLVARIFVDACAGLHYAHLLKDAHGSQLNVIHRDISPGNLLVSYEGVAKVLDFGVAKANSQLAKTVAGTLKGKFAYMSPEQIQMKYLDARVDVWSLGVVLWESLTVRRLFTGVNELALARSILDDPIPSPSIVDPQIPAGIERIAMRALQRDRNRRYPNAEAMRSDLEAFLRTLPTPPAAADVAAFVKQIFAEEFTAHGKLLADAPQATPEQLAELIKFETTTSMPSFSGVSEAKPYREYRRQKRRTTIMAAIGAAAVVLASVVGLLLWRPWLVADAKATGSIEVVTEPAGAIIYLDGARQLPSPVTIPAVAANIEHTVIADKDGFEVETKTIKVERRTQLSVTIALRAKAQTAPAVPTAVKLAVTSTPAGARVVRVDSGELLGTTPLEKTVAASVDEVQLRLELSGYQPAVRKVTLVVDTTLEIALARQKSAVTKTGETLPPGTKPENNNQGATADGVVDPFAH